MQNDHDYDTNLGWWTEKPDRKMHPSSSGPIYGPYRRRKDRVWFKSALLIALMVAFGWSLLHLAGIAS